MVRGLADSGIGLFSRREIRIARRGGRGRRGGRPRRVVQDGGDAPRFHAVALRHLICFGSVNNRSDGDGRLIKILLLTEGDVRKG